jgi:hypothetical protein
LGELSPQVTERASLWPQSRGGVIGKSFVRAIISLRFGPPVSALALSVCFADTSPKGRGLKYAAVSR